MMGILCWNGKWSNLVKNGNRMKLNKLNYKFDASSEEDVLRHAKALENHVVGDVYELEKQGKKRADVLDRYNEIRITGGNLPNGKTVKHAKGNIGNLVQEIYFGIPVNSDRHSDIKGCGVELKVSKLVELKSKGLRVKERLVLGMINSHDLLPQNFENSHVYEKCRLILLVYYINRKSDGFTPFQFPFYKSVYMTIPHCDLPQIKRDYEYIRDCVNRKQYNQLHEHCAKYLSPAPKNGKRAFSFKVSYMNQIFEEYIKSGILMYKPNANNYSFQLKQKYESIVKDERELARKSLEEIVYEKFQKYKDKTIFEIRKQLMKKTEYKEWLSSRSSMPNKAELAKTTFLMLGIKGNKAEEFEKAGVYVKTLKVNKDGSMNEDISFPAFEFEELVSQSWTESSVYSDIIAREFFWAVFQDSDEGFKFRGVKFWTVPIDDVGEIKKGWRDIRSVVKNNRVRFYEKKRGKGKPIIWNSFPDSQNTQKGSEKYRVCRASCGLNRIIAIRPHTSQVFYDLKSIGYSDTSHNRFNGSVLPNGDVMTKQCFWLQNEYVLKAVRDLLVIPDVESVTE